ncbi:GNAT family N-acetyltransferase [Bacillaceae bacterium S4-13-58]
MEKKVTWLQGEDYITIEEREELNQTEWSQIIHKVESKPFPKKRFVLFEPVSSFKKEDLIEHKYSFIKRRVLVKRELEPFSTTHRFSFSFEGLKRMGVSSFIEYWNRVIEESPYQKQNVEQEWRNLQLELGEDYAKGCFAIFKGDDAIGVVILHIEPGTQEEGRIYFWGLFPEYRGKGWAAPIHEQALYMLKSHFHAKEYVGCTDEDHLAMLKVFEENECWVQSKIAIYEKGG